MEGEAMKYILGISLALMAGVLIGVLSQRPEVHDAQLRIEELEARDCSSSRGIGRGLAAAMQGRPGGMLDFGEDEEPVEPGEGDEDAAADEDEGGGVEFEIDLGDRDEDELPEEWDEEDVRRELDALVTAQDLRRTQARAALVEQADPTDDELETFDQTMEAMNDELMGLTEELVQQLESGEEITRHDMMTYAADLLDVMLEADENVAGVVGEGVDIDDEAYDPFSYIDPDIISALGELDL
jgi:hypothetical protein